MLGRLQAEERDHEFNATWATLQGFLSQVNNRKKCTVLSAWKEAILIVVLAVILFFFFPHTWLSFFRYCHLLSLRQVLLTDLTLLKLVMWPWYLSVFLVQLWDCILNTSSRCQTPVLTEPSITQYCILLIYKAPPLVNDLLTNLLTSNEGSQLLLGEERQFLQWYSQCLYNSLSKLTRNPNLLGHPPKKDSKVEGELVGRWMGQWEGMAVLLSFYCQPDPT